MIRTSWFRTENIQDKVWSDGGGRAEGVFTALYDFTGQDSSQLNFKRGEQVSRLSLTHNDILYSWKLL